MHNNRYHDDEEIDINPFAESARYTSPDAIGRFASEISGVGDSGRYNEPRHASPTVKRRSERREYERTAQRQYNNNDPRRTESADRRQPYGNRGNGYSRQGAVRGHGGSPQRNGNAQRGGSPRSGGTSVVRRYGTANAKSQPQRKPQSRPAQRTAAYSPDVKKYAALGVLGLALLTCIILLIFHGKGAKLIERKGVLEELCRHYDVFSAYSPKAGKAKGALPMVLSESDSPTDMPVVYVSESELVPKGYADVSGKSRFFMALKTGFNSLYASSNDIELIVVHEAGTGSLPPSAFAAEGSKKQLVYTIAPTRKQLDTPGCYILQISDGKKLSNVLLVVKDTTPPEISVSDLTVWQGDEIRETDFITSCKDMSPVIVSFDSLLPEAADIGPQKLSLRIRDIYGNEVGVVDTTVDVVTDTEAPVIKGVENRTVVLGEAIAYKKDITLTDNRDSAEQMTLTVDSSEVDTKKSGKYKVTYTATDRAGNSSSKSMTLTILTESERQKEEQLKKYVTKVAKSIFKSGMTDTQKLRAIYNWTHAHLRYTGSSIKDNWRDGALRGFKTHAGDCYTYFSCSKALMEYCGFQNIDVQKNRKPGQSRHYWSMVNLGTGWYHFDSCIRHNTFNGFMRTDAQLEKYSKANDGSHRIDKSKYPATPKKAFNLK